MNRQSKSRWFKPFSSLNFSLKSFLFILAAICIAPDTVALYAQTASLDLFVSSRNTNSVKRYDGETGAYLGDFVKPGSGGLSVTQEVLFGLDGHLLVSGRGNKYILKFDRDTGNFLGNFTSGYELDNPTKMTRGPDNLLYVSQWGVQKSKVVRFNFSSGAFVDEFTEINLNQGCGHAWDAAGNLYVACYGSADVRKFDPQGKFLGVFAGAGRLHGAVNLWFDESDDLLVVDWILGAVLRFNGQTGGFKSNFITGMLNTEGFAFDPEGTLYLCDWSRNTVNRYDRTGGFLGVFANTGGMLAPNSVTFGPPSATAVLQRENLPHNFALRQNYPNPFNPATRIAFELPVESRVTLTVFEVNGKTVAELQRDQLQASGHHSIKFMPQGLASGVYFYELKAIPLQSSLPSFVARKTMVFMR